MPPYTYRNRRTGETITMPWEGDAPPSPEDFDLYRRQNQQGFVSRAWDWLNKPLTDAPSRAARYLTSIQPNHDDIYQTMNDYVPGLGTLASEYEGFQKGAVEGVGDIVSNLTSPASIGLTLATAGAGGAARLGLGGTARALRAAEAAGGAAYAAHGGYKAATGKTLGERGAGLVEAAGGLLGTRSGLQGMKPPVVQPITNPARLLMDVNPVEEPSFNGPRFYAGNAGIADAKHGNYVEDFGSIANPFTENAQNMTWGPEQIGEQVKQDPRIAAEFGLGVNKPVINPIVEPVQPEMMNPVGDPNVLKPGQIAPRNRPQIVARPENMRQVEAGVIKDIVNDELNLPVDAEGNITRANIPKRGRGLDDIMDVPDPNAPPGNVQPVNNQGAAPNPRIQQAKALLKNKKAIGDAARAAGVPLRQFRQQLQKFIKDEGGYFDVGRMEDVFGAARDKIAGGLADAKNKFRIKSSDVERTVPQAAEFLRNWMGQRAASETRGVLEGRKFRPYDSSDVSKLIEIQDNPDKFPDVRDYFKGARERAIDADLALGLKENYLPQLWDNTPEEVSQAFSKKFGTPEKVADPLAAERQPQGRVTMKPSFTLKSVIENYKEGVGLGLKPKFTNTSDLVHWYEKTLNKSIADRDFFFKMRDAGLIRPAGKAPTGWANLKADYFPSFGRRGEARRLWSAHPDVVKAIENYIKQPEGFMQAAGEVTGLSKDIALSSGMMPGTAANAHGFNILARNAANRGVLKGTLEGIKYMLNTGADNPIARGIEKVAPWQSARAYLDANLEKAPEFVEKGLNLSTEGFQFGEARHTNAFLKAHGKYFEDPLFQNMIPALKLKHVQDVTKSLMESGMEKNEAMTQASKITNDAFGGINTDQMFRNKDFQNVLRTFLIAPDWLESNVRTGGRMASSFGKSPVAAQGRKMALNLMSAYIMGNVANKTLSGHYMWENDPGHSMQIDTGSDIKSGGKKKRTYINPFGTAFDAIRLPAETAASLAKGDTSQAGRIMRNRLSAPVGSALNYMFNEDWRDRPLGGKDAYGRQIPFGRQVVNQLSNVTDPFTPQYISAVKDMMMNNTSPWEAGVGAVEAPVRFSARPRSKKAQRRQRR